ncbi:hypothetical protein HS7_18530 [Sulfolobales archaeon HS-7]|nr:hypothetical protein HS7_18530 [Sulfolobales archaeon HS-7]
MGLQAIFGIVFAIIFYFISVVTVLASYGNLEDSYTALGTTSNYRWGTNSNYARAFGVIALGTSMISMLLILIHGLFFGLYGLIAIADLLCLIPAAFATALSTRYNPSLFRTIFNLRYTAIFSITLLISAIIYLFVIYV